PRSATREGRHCIDAFVGDQLQLAVNAAAAQPGENRFAQLSFLAVVTGRIAEIEAEIDKILLGLFDAIDEFIVGRVLFHFFSLSSFRIAQGTPDPLWGRGKLANPDSRRSGDGV